MAKGRQGFMLEGWKFAVYITIPLVASWYFNDPERQKQNAEYWKYVQYPANPATGLKEQIKLRQEQRAQHDAYSAQLQQLQVQANRSINDSEEKRSSASWSSFWR
jgi:Pet100